MSTPWEGVGECKIQAKNYLDIVNLDKYDCILGTLFLRKCGISLDFQFQDIVICKELHIPTLPEKEGTSMMKPVWCGKWLHDQEQWAEGSLTHVEFSKSPQNPVMIEEVEDDNIHKMNAINKLDTDSIHIMESDDDDKGILFKCQYMKETWQHWDIPQEKPKDKLTEVPSHYGKYFERKSVPKMTERSVLRLHSDNFKYKGPSPKDEVLLPAMDANINKLKKGDEDLPELYKKWVEAAADILTGAPSHLPPLWEVNHRIPIIDENKWYNYHLLWCPESLKTQLINKIQTYKNAGWLEETSISQAAPMLCVFKKDGVKLHTVIDGCKHNDNIEKNMTLFPNQEQIHHDVAQAKYWSKIDMSNTYEQIHVEPKNVWKTVFATIYGTFLSHTMQQGDCNTPATFQWLMTIIFWDYIGRFVHVYLDD